MIFMNYLNYVRNVLLVTYGDKSTNTIRILYTLNNFPHGATYTQILNYHTAFNQSALSRALQNCLNRNHIIYDSAKKVYISNYFFDTTVMDDDRINWLEKLLSSRLVGSNTTLIRIVIYLSAVGTIDLNNLAREIQSTMELTESAILSITDELGTEIITYDKNSNQVSANLNWF